ncbi:MAG: lysophospholipid acyltransferase family protein [Gallionella sp.]|nr:lysophospholipid acyltransferase family protein [Gallionella sp.]
MLVANHISWLDIFVLNAIYPARFIAKAEVRSWPLIGWLCQRSGTLFIERTLRKDAAAINLKIAGLLKQGQCVGLFPEGTTTDGKRVGHFHSALFQPAIDAGARICPVALHYQESCGRPSTVTAFTGEMTLAASIWRILRCPRLDAFAASTPALATSHDNRRVLALAAQRAIAEKLQMSSSKMDFTELPAPPPQLLFAAQSAYVLLLDPILHGLHK